MKYAGCRLLLLLKVPDLIEPSAEEPNLSAPPASPSNRDVPSNNSAHSPLPLVDSLVARTDYDTRLADRAVRFPQLLFDGRFWQLGFALVTFVFTSTFSIIFPTKNISNSDRQREKAKKFRQLLFDLGPTFIKLGQFLSVRRDMLPLELAEELTLLQDQVPPFDIEMVRQTIKSDLGSMPEDLFLEFESVPIASASIGQVHRVKLKDGSDAVLKVQRPGLSEQFYRDLGLMRLAAGWWLMLAKLGANWRERTTKPPSGKSLNPTQPASFTRHRPLDVKGWLELSDEFGRVLFSEIDYLKEGRNADRLRKLVRPKPHIRVPRVHWRYTGRHVLALEYIPGTKISQARELEAKGFDLEKVGNMLVNCYLEQFVLTGFFHADPHAGNLAIDDDGRLIIYDFGMMGEISEDHRQALLACVMAVVRRDLDMVTRNLQELGIVSKAAPVEAVSRTIAPFIDYYAGRDIMDLDFHNLESDIDHVIAERSFRLPANLAYLLRSGSSLEGIARTLKPDFSFASAVRPVMTRWALQQGIETLAKNGKLLTFAAFAFNEIRASVKAVPGNIAAEASGGGKNSSPTAKLNSESKFKLSGQGTSSGNVGKEFSVVLPVVTVVCNECARHEDYIQTMHTKLVSFMWVYLVISVVMTAFLAYVSSLVCRPFCLYFLIGNIGLGAIIFLQFTKLLKWSSQRSTEVQSSGAKKATAKGGTELTRS